MSAKAQIKENESKLKGQLIGMKVKCFQNFDTD